MYSKQGTYGKRYEDWMGGGGVHTHTHSMASRSYYTWVEPIPDFIESFWWNGLENTWNGGDSTLDFP